MLLLLAVAVPLGLDLLVPVPQDSPMTPESITLGRRLFQDKRLSRDGSVSCATCHDPERAFSDSRRIAVGIGGRKGRRHAPALINRAYGTSFFWDGRSKSLEAQVVMPIEDPNEMDLSLQEASARVELPPHEIARALASFVRSLLSGNSRYDRFAAGESSVLTPREKQGLELFRGKANCAVCHVGPNFTDEQFHNTGVAWRNGRLEDEGVGQGRFRTPTLRDLMRTAPYMHDGSFDTLTDIIEFYEKGGRANPALDPEIRSLRLTEDEKGALAEFLATLTGSK